MSAEQIARELPAHAEPETEGSFELWADHLPAFLLMGGFDTQWRTAVLHEHLVYIGFDYSVMPVVERGTGVTCTPDVFHHLQVMELEAAKTRNAT